jgi:SNF2 family DNA or RNA helicase
VDEAHNMRNRKSKRTTAIMEIGKRAEHRYVLTGTPAVSKGYDIFPLLQFLYPKKFSSYWGFLERYFEMKREFFSGSMQPTGNYIRQEELEDILAMISTNRKRKEVMAWLPDKQYQTIPIELTPKQQKAYDQILETFMYEEDGDVMVNASSVLAQLTRLRQVCLAPSLLDIKAPSAKEEFLMEWLQDNNEPVIIFSQFTSYIKELAERIKENLKEEVVMIHGEMSGKEKQNSVEQFQSGKVRILLANIIAAGVGFTLDRAETTIFLDKAWNPADNFQAEDRMVPVSKERNHGLTVISLVASGTYDERLDLLLQNKYSITEVINSGGLKAIDRIYKELNGSDTPVPHI